MHFPIRLIFLLFILNIPLTNAQKSVARDWNEELLDAIRDDFARPTVHARNLFHSSMIMYDAWAVFDCKAETFFLGKTFGGYTSNFGGIEIAENPNEAIHEVISYAMFKLLSHRFANSPGAGTSLPSFRSRMESYGYNPDFDSIDYSTGSFAALGNYLAQEVISFGLQDNSYEQEAYANQHYVPINEPLILQEYTETIEIDPNRWQPLSFDQFVDQSGNTVATAIPEFLGPEWGEVIPFALDQTNMEVLNRSFDSYIYNDPGPPVYIQNSTGSGISDPYKWHFALVIAWSAHLDPDDSTLIDISPGAIGNVDLESYPTTFDEFQEFYNFEFGGDSGIGHAINPITNSIYEPQLIKRGDYARVLAEFWADGPDSETPPGHWFTILNYVSDHPQTVKKIEGKGVILDDLEWDVKSYLALGGAMHDSAINTWGIKGYYDYIRPISAIRYMASLGQSSNVSLPSFHPHGLPLIDGLIEVITAGDSLEGENGENIGKIKTFSWKGPDFIDNPETDVSGVDWIPGTHWWPYQRGTFVTPPFAGYVSGHSTFSRAAAEVLTLLTGNPFFPAGMGTFNIEQNEFLVFEEGPTESLTLQWATYRDASDQTSLSRIWGGIHPPIDDIAGRIIGDKIGKQAFNLALEYFNENSENCTIAQSTVLYPVPYNEQIELNTSYGGILIFRVFGLNGKLVYEEKFESSADVPIVIQTPTLSQGVFIAIIYGEDGKVIHSQKILKN